MPNEYIREIGRPQIERQTNGKRKITRRFVAHGPSVDQGTIEEDLFLPYANIATGAHTADEEYGTAYLIQQGIEPGEDKSQAVLIRVYQELDTTPLEIGKPLRTRDANNLLAITRKYIVETQYAASWADNIIGTKEFEGALLAKLKVQERVVYTEIEEIYKEKGVISFKEDKYHNGALLQRVYRTVGLNQAELEAVPHAPDLASAPWALVTEMSGSGDTDFEFGGMEVLTWHYAKGEGLIATETADKGPVEITTERIITKYVEGATAASPYESFSDIPSDQRYHVEHREERGYHLWVIKGVIGEGEIDRREETKHNGALSIITIKNIGQQSSAPGGYVRISEDHDQSGSYDIFTDVYARGLGQITQETREIGEAIILKTVTLQPEGVAFDTDLGENDLRKDVDYRDGYSVITLETRDPQSGAVDEKVETKDGGALTIWTQTTLGTTWNLPVPDGSAVIIVERDHTYDRYPALTRVYAKGTGQVVEETKKVGQASVVTKVTLFGPDIDFDTALADYELSRKIDKQDGYTIVTVTERDEESGIVDSRTEERHNGKLTIKTITQLGSSFLPGNIPAGYTEISTREHRYDDYAAITNVYASGAGIVSRETRQVGQTEVDQTVTLYSPTGYSYDSSLTGDMLKKSWEERDGYVIETLVERDSLSGVVDSKTETRHNGALVIETVTQLGDTWIADNTPAGYEEIVTRTHTFDDFPAMTKVFAKGQGQITEERRQVGQTEVLTTVTLEPGESPFDTALLDGDLKREVSLRDGYSIITTTSRGDQSGVVDSRTEYKNNGALEIRSVTQLGDAWVSTNTPANFVEISTRNHTYDEYPAITKVYAEGQGQVSEETRKVGQTEVLTTVTLHPGEYAFDTTLADDELKRDVSYRDGHSVVTITTRSDQSGIVDSRVEYKHNGALEIRTVTQLGENFLPANVPAGFAELSERSHTFDDFPAVTKVFAKGSGLIKTSNETKGSAVLSEEQYLGQPNAAAPAPSWADEDNFYSETRELDGHLLYTFRGASADGVIDIIDSVVISDEINRRTIRKIGSEPVSPGGNWHEIGSREDDSGNFTIYEKTFLRVVQGAIATSEEDRGNATITTETIVAGPSDGEPTSSIPADERIKTASEDKAGYVVWTFRGIRIDDAGIVDDKEEIRYEGALVIRDLRALGGVPSALPDFPISTGAYTKIVSRSYFEGELEFFQEVWVKGDGEIMDRIEDKGSLVTVYTKAHIVGEGATDPSLTQANVLSRQYDAKDGYQVVTYKYYTGTGQYYETVEERHNGKLVITTRRFFGDQAIPAAAVDYGYDNSGDIAVTWYKLVTGEGRFYEEERGGTDGFIYHTIKYINQDFGAAPPNGELLSTVEDQRDGYTIYTEVYIEPPGGEIEVKVVTDDKGITYTTVMSVGVPPVRVGAPIVHKKEEQIPTVGGNIIFKYTYTFVTGEGEFYRSTNTIKRLTRTRTRSINDIPADQAAGCIVEKKEIEHKDVNGALAYTEYDIVTVAGDGEFERDIRNEGPLTWTTIKFVGQLDPAWAALGGIINEKTNILQSIEGGDCAFIGEVTILSGTGLWEKSTSTKDGVEYTKIKEVSLGANPVTFNAKNIQVSATELRDTIGAVFGYILEYTHAEGTGEVYWEESVDSNGLNRLTQKIVDANPPGNGGCIVHREEEVTKDVNGGVAFTRRTWTFASGYGELGRSVTETQYGQRITTVESLGQAPPVGPANSCIVEKFEEVAKDVDGNDCAYKRFKYRFLEGTGVFERSVDHREDGTTIETVKSVVLGGAAGAGCPDSNLPSPCLVSKRTEEIPGFDCDHTLVVCQYMSGEGELSRGVSTKDQLVYTTIRTFKVEPVGPVGSCLVKKETQERPDIDGQDCNIFYNYTFVSCSDSESESTEVRDNIEYKTIRTCRSYVSDGSVVGFCKFSESTEEIKDVNGDDCLTIYTFIYVRAIEHEQTTTEQRNELTYTSIRKVGGVAPVAPAGGCLVSTVDEEVYGPDSSSAPCYTIWKRTWVTGDGEISSQCWADGGVEFERRMSIGTAPPTPGDSNACLFRKEEAPIFYLEGADCPIKYDYTWVTALEEETETAEVRNGLKYVSVRKVGGGAPTRSGCPVKESEERVHGCGGYCYSIWNYTWRASCTGVLSETADIRNNVRFKTFRSCESYVADDLVVGYCKLSTSEEAQYDLNGVVCDTIYILVYVSPIETEEVSTEQRGDLTYTTKKKTGGDTPPTAPPNGCLVAQADEDFYSDDGTICYTIYKRTWVAGTGEVSNHCWGSDGVAFERVVRFDVVAPSAPSSNSCLWKRDESPVLSVDGGTCLIKYDYTWAEALEEETETTEARNNLKYISVRKVGGGAPSRPGCPVKESEERVHGCSGYCHSVWNYTWRASCTGVLSETIEIRNNIRFKTFRSCTSYVDDGLVIGWCLLNTSEEAQYDLNGVVCDTIYTLIYVQAIETEEVSTEQRGDLTYTTKKKTGGDTPPTAPSNGCLVLQADEEVLSDTGTACYTIYKRTWVTGSGEISNHCWVSNGVEFERRAYIGSSPPSPSPSGMGPASSCLWKRDESPILNVDGGTCLTKYDYTWAYALEVEDETIEARDNLQYTTVRKVGGAAPSRTGCLVKQSEEQVWACGGYCYSIWNYTWLTGDGELSRREWAEDALQYAEIVRMGAQPTAPTGMHLISKKETTMASADGSDCDVIYTHKFVKGEGCIDERTKISGNRTYTTKVCIGTPPDHCTGTNSKWVDKTEKQVKAVNGDVAYTIYEYTCLEAGDLVEVLDFVYHKDGSITAIQASIINKQPLNASTITSNQSSFIIRDTEDKRGDFTVYTQERWWAPEGLTYSSSVGGYRLGMVAMNADGQLYTTRAPKHGEIPCDVTVEYTEAPGGNDEFDAMEWPTLMEFHITPDGSTYHSRRIYVGYRLDTSGSAGGSDQKLVVDRNHVNVNGMWAIKLHKELHGGTSVGSEAIMRQTVTPYYRNHGVTVYQKMTFRDQNI
jgi:hypothetical protein